jgi:hypothetical protein
MQLKHSARMTNVPQLGVPDIFVEDEDDRAKAGPASGATDAGAAGSQQQPAGTLLHAGSMSARNRPTSAWTSGRLAHDDLESPYMQDLDPQQAAYQSQKSQHHRSAPSRSRNDVASPPVPPAGWQLQESQVQPAARSRSSLTNTPFPPSGSSSTAAPVPSQHPLSLPPRPRQGRASDEHEPLSPGHRTNTSAFSFELHEPPDEGLGEDRDTTTLAPHQVREMLDDSVWLQSIRRSATMKRSAWNNYR